MPSTVEMILWAIHHATTLLFGVFASAALCGIEINRRHALELVMVSAVTGCAFGLANAVGGELFARQAYPLVVHLPLVIYLCARYRLSPLLVMLGVTSAYLSCQFSNWMGIAALAATDSQIAYYAARIITTVAVFAILLHWASDIRAWRLKAPPSSRFCSSCRSSITSLTALPTSTPRSSTRAP